jgi:hypothetical protein
MHAFSEDEFTSFEPDFHRPVIIEFSAHRITFNAGATLLREADFRLKLTDSIAIGLVDTHY